MSSCLCGFVSFVQSVAVGLCLPLYIHIVFIIELSHFFECFELFCSVVILVCVSVRYYNAAGLSRYRPCCVDYFHTRLRVYCFAKLVASVINKYAQVTFVVTQSIHKMSSFEVVVLKTVLFFEASDTDCDLL